MSKTFFKICALYIGISTQVSAIDKQIEFPKPALVPGGIALLTLENYEPGTTVKFNNENAAVLSYKDRWIALGGISLSSKEGKAHVFSVQQKNGVSFKTKVEIEDKQYPIQRLTVKNKRKVNPNPEDLKRISVERIRKTKAKTYWSDPNPIFDFAWPVEGRISSTFGLRRFFNEQERRPHSGLDIAADEGTPIKATASGTVIEAGDFFFSGNMIYIDHGQSIISLYAHLSRIDVKPGDIVKQGDIIGAVGQTGRVTGPHLHFAILANKTLIDPIYILSNNK